MKVFESDAIRNICIVGHGAAGKTSLTSAILFNSGAVNRLARVEDGNTVTDWEEEEIERKISISSALAYCEWNRKKRFSQTICTIHGNALPASGGRAQVGQSP